MNVVSMADAPLSNTRDLLMPAVYAMMAYAGPGVKQAEIRPNFAEDSLELVVLHTLFSGNELRDGSFKANCRLRLQRALLADAPKDGRRVTVERRSFLARAAKIRKSKPKKVHR